MTRAPFTAGSNSIFGQFVAQGNNATSIKLLYSPIIFIHQVVVLVATKQLLVLRVEAAVEVAIMPHVAQLALLRPPPYHRVLL